MVLTSPIVDEFYHPRTAVRGKLGPRRRAGVFVKPGFQRGVSAILLTPVEQTQKFSAANSCGNAPLVRSRLANSASAARRSATVKSGQRFCKKTSSANAHSQRRKSDKRCSPPVRIRRSTSVEPPRQPSDSTAGNDSCQSSVAL